jgi:hypothetical protein
MLQSTIPGSFITYIVIRDGRSAVSRQERANCFRGRAWTNAMDGALTFDAKPLPIEISIIIM